MPHTSQLHTIERVTRRDFNTLTYEITVDDLAPTPRYGRRLHETLGRTSSRSSMCAREATTDRGS